MSDPRFTALLGPPGSGKLLPNSELVLTPKGFVRNDSLKIGDYVISGYGTPTRILKIHESDHALIHTIWFSDFTSIKACTDHLWKLSDGSVVTTKELQVNNSLALPAPIEFEPKFLLPVRLVKDLFTKSWYPYSFIANLIRIDSYLLGSVEQRLELLRALMDELGFISLEGDRIRTIELRTESYALYELVQSLVRSLGGVCCSSYKESRIVMSIEMSLNCFSTESKSSVFESSKPRNMTKRVIFIEPAVIGSGRCIEIESPCHTYVVRDYILTHNSHSTKQALALNPKYGMKCATTGIAAINLQDEYGSAVTINSALGFYDTKDLLYKVSGKALDKTLTRIAGNYERILVDECSLMNAPSLELLYRAVKDFNERAGTSLGLRLIGDFLQLPAIGGPPAFMAKCWKDFDIEVLDKIYRQQDAHFIEALRLVRKGLGREAVEYFESEVGFHSSIDKDFNGSTFFGTNSEVDQYNYHSFSKLKGIVNGYDSYRTGKQRSEWSNIPNTLNLKEGALVIILSNNTKQSYANGDLATVVSMGENFVDVVLERDGRAVRVEYIKVKNEYMGSSLGSVSYLPLRLAWACTAHKSQGLSLDRVQVHMGSRFMSNTSGMLYVAMSRVRTKEGLRLVGSRTDFINSVHVDPIYRNFITEYNV